MHEARQSSMNSTKMTLQCACGIAKGNEHKLLQQIRRIVNCEKKLYHAHFKSAETPEKVVYAINPSSHPSC